MNSLVLSPGSSQSLGTGSPCRTGRAQHLQDQGDIPCGCNGHFLALGEGRSRIVFRCFQNPSERHSHLSHTSQGLTSGSLPAETNSWQAALIPADRGHSAGRPQECSGLRHWACWSLCPDAVAHNLAGDLKLLITEW